MSIVINLCSCCLYVYRLFGRTRFRLGTDVAGLLTPAVRPGDAHVETTGSLCIPLLNRFFNGRGSLVTNARLFVVPPRGRGPRLGYRPELRLFKLLGERPSPAAIVCRTGLFTRPSFIKVLSSASEPMNERCQYNGVKFEDAKLILTCMKGDLLTFYFCFICFCGVIRRSEPATLVGYKWRRRFESVLRVGTKVRERYRVGSADDTVSPHRPVRDVSTAASTHTRKTFTHFYSVTNEVRRDGHIVAIASADEEIYILIRDDEPRHLLISTG
jgi:hypothetical protein